MSTEDLVLNNLLRGFMGKWKIFLSKKFDITQANF